MVLKISRSYTDAVWMVRQMPKEKDTATDGIGIFFFLFVGRGRSVIKLLNASRTLKTECPADSNHHKYSVPTT